MELKDHVELSVMQRFQLWMHTTMCSGCRNYMKHSRLINQLLQKNLNDTHTVENTDELEAAILGRL